MKNVSTYDQYIRESAGNDFYPLNEGLMDDLRRKFDLEEIKRQLTEKLGIDQNSTKKEIAEILAAHVVGKAILGSVFVIGPALMGFVLYLFSLAMNATSGGDSAFATPESRWIAFAAGAIIGLWRTTVHFRATSRKKADIPEKDPPANENRWNRPSVNEGRRS